MPPNNPADLNLNYLVPIVTTDGNGIFIRDGDNVPVLTFFQVRKQEGNKVSADVVASVRLNNLAELEQLQKSIATTIKEHKAKEK